MLIFWISIFFIQSPSCSVGWSHTPNQPDLVAGSLAFMSIRPLDGSLGEELDRSRLESEAHEYFDSDNQWPELPLLFFCLAKAVQDMGVVMIIRMRHLLGDNNNNNNHQKESPTVLPPHNVPAVVTT